MLDYRRAVWGRAVSDYKAWLHKGKEAVIPFIVQTAVVLAILYYQPWVGSAGDQSKAVGAGVAAVVVTAAVRFLWQVFHAPAAIWSEDRAAIDDFERRLTPRVTVALHNEGRPDTLPDGETYLGLECRNKTDRAMENCEAFIVGFRAEGERTDELDNELILEWVLVGGRPDNFAQMVPGAVRTLIVAYLDEKGKPVLRRATYPSPYPQIFNRPGNFIGRIAFKEHWGGGTLVDFKIVRDGPGPVLELLGETMPVDTEHLLDMREGLKA